MFGTRNDGATRFRLLGNIWSITMMQVKGVSPEILKKSATVQVISFDVTPKRISSEMVYIDKKGRHMHPVTWDRSINPMLYLAKALHCGCTNCMYRPEKFCTLKTRFAFELMARGYWDRMIERYLIGDSV